MNIVEQEIETYKRRIKRMEENPDPRMLRSNMMSYELEMEMCQELLDNWRAGKPVVDSFQWGILLRSMGIAPWGLQRTVYHLRDNAQRYFDILRAQGVYDYGCDMAMIPWAIMLSGDVPKPDAVAVMPGVNCTPMMMEFYGYAQMLEIPCFMIDSAYDDDEANLRYMTDQLGQFIEWLEWKFPGHKYNEDRLIELQEYDKMFRNCLRETYPLQRLKPPPIGGLDVFRIENYPSAHPNPAKVVEYGRMRRDEILERAEKGIGAIPEEKMRMLWAVTGPWWFFNQFKALAKWGIVVPFFYDGVTPEFFGAHVPPRTWGGRGFEDLSPLEKVAAFHPVYPWGGLGDRWVNGMMWICKDLGIEAIVSYLMVGCSAVCGLKKIVTDTAERELGVPVLHLPGRQVDPSWTTPEQMEAMLDDFAQMCLTKKGITPKKVEGR